MAMEEGGESGKALALFAGVWELDVAASVFGPGGAPEKDTYTITVVDDQVKFCFLTLMANGSTVTQSYSTDLRGTPSHVNTYGVATMSSTLYSEGSSWVLDSKAFADDGTLAVDARRVVQEQTPQEMVIEMHISIPPDYVKVKDIRAVYRRA